MNLPRRLVLCLLALPGLAPGMIAAADDDIMRALAASSYAGIEEQIITLVDGSWEGEPFVEGGSSRPRAGLVETFHLKGDLDHDGKDEIVAMLWQSGGGSGTFDYLAVMSDDGESLKNVATAPVGDRVQVQSGTISDGQILLQVIQAGPEDPACCPSQRVARSWRLGEGQLEEQEMQMQGPLSVSVLDGTSWTMSKLPGDRHMPEGFNVSISFEQGRLAGHSGCNRFSAPFEDGESPGEVRVGAAMSTRMACPEPLMQAEMEFLDLLGRVDSFSFSGGQLLLSGQKETFHFSIRFDSN